MSSHRRSVTVGDGKYRVEFDEMDGNLNVFRHGELWSNEAGNKFVLCMMQRIEELQDKEETLQETINTMYSLLDDAHTIMGDSHCDDNEVYSEVSDFLYKFNRE
ncbi:hypothetical protein BI001_gp237 [Bacillus phage Zuko]|uniref:hypothetical protein n=1 Tax=Bacillus phage Zuko TaxID=1805956 RepID=UPI0007A777FE|nr:hypothetical protein BI001_gp237 [Bacillus phage Zuko]AMW62550.1 hypothetical protein ZUKO_141 [Bacillus phage Zuko]AXF41985.1 hypothetical protein [Bacillus phage Saddex]